MAAICKAGICCTPILLATQVVPHTIQVVASAMYPLVFAEAKVLFLEIYFSAQEGSIKPAK